MTNAILLLALLVGQAPAPERISIMFEDSSIEVIGTRSASGKISWYPDHPENVQAVADARAKKAALVAFNKRTGADIDINLPAPKKGEDAGLVPAALRNGIMHRPKPTMRGYTATTPEAKAAVRRIADGSGPPQMLHVVLIGSAADRAPIEHDLATNPIFARVKERLWVQPFDPSIPQDDVMVSQALGFPRGKPAILISAAKGPNYKEGGLPLWRKHDYSEGPDGLYAGIVEALRVADPKFNPADPLNPGGDIIIIPPWFSPLKEGRKFLNANPGVVVGAFIGLLLVVSLPKKGA